MWTEGPFEKSKYLWPGTCTLIPLDAVVLPGISTLGPVWADNVFFGLIGYFGGISTLWPVQTDNFLDGLGEGGGGGWSTCFHQVLSFGGGDFLPIGPFLSPQFSSCITKSTITTIMMILNVGWATKLTSSSTTKLPYRAVKFPFKGSKKIEWPTRFWLPVTWSTENQSKCRKIGRVAHPISAVKMCKISVENIAKPGGPLNFFTALK